jgi:hypothetical protein
MRVTRESMLLAAICIADLTTTIWFVNGMGAQEANPMMRFYLDRGVAPFVAAKLLLFVGPLAVLEWARRRHPRFVRTMLRLGIALYVGFYGMVVWRINTPVEGTPLSLWQMAAIERECARPFSAADAAMMRAHLRGQ